MEYWKPLEDCPLFRGVDYISIEALLQEVGTKEVVFEKGEFFSLQQVVDLHIIIVVSGRIRLNSPFAKGNSERMIEHLSPSDAFGLAFAVVDATVPGSAQVLTRSTILRIPAKKFLDLISMGTPVHLQVGKNILEELAQKVHMNAQRLTYLRYRSLKKMLSAYLLDHAPPKENETFSLPINKTMLADLFGVSRSAMVRVLSQLKTEGILSYHLNEYEIHNKEALWRILD